MTKLNLLFFASLGEQLNCREMTLELEDSVDSVAKLIAYLCLKDHKWQLLKQDNLKIAVNQFIVDVNCRISHGDEIAIFPPVTGG